MGSLRLVTNRSFDEVGVEREILVIGLGNMGMSLINGIVKNNKFSSVNLKVQAFDINKDKRDKARADGLIVLESISDFSATNRCIILCIKPHDLLGIAQELSAQTSESDILVSILAGTKIERIAGKIHHSGPIVRAMPNIAATVGCAATALTANEKCSKGDRDFVKKIFDGVGESYWTAEKMMDVVTGLSGSGPTYIYMVIEALTDGGVKMGMPRELARNLATQTVLGAATLVKKSGLHPAVLKDQVSTPAGTTINALVELESHGLRSMFVSAVVAATERSRAIGKLQED